MKLFFFDTETTWLNSDDQILQFWGIFWTFDWVKFHEERRINQLINVSKEISPDAERIHGIDKNKVKNLWYIEDYIDEILLYIKKADYIIWHNLDFDIKMLKQECNRIWQDFSRDNIKSFCTMKETIDILNLPGKKRPKLSELYYYLFNKHFNNAHDAMADIEATKDCFIELTRLELINFDKFLWKKQKKIWDVQLIRAVCDWNIEKIKKLIQDWVDIEVKDVENDDWDPDDISWSTPLIYASNIWDINIVKLLVENWANIESKTNYSWRTPLMHACHKWHIKIVAYLLACWADIETQDKDWDTPLIWASLCWHTGVVRLLLEYWANVDVKSNCSWRTPLTAINEAYANIIKLMSNHSKWIK